MDSQRFRSLPPRQRALVAIALLLDGRDAGIYLENDAVYGNGLKRAADELALLEPEMRMPFVGTVLRDALSNMKV